uniref:Carboxylic ester hydrolase n=1 Tax=Ciona savignyi TaxID=51511 RepID=H2ZN22_CIOSA
MTSEFGNSCIQEDDLVFGNFTGSQMWNSPNAKSEDCLYLNVWTPVRSRHAEPLAVLVWIYGGSYYSGTSSLALYDGRYLAATGGVVVVSLNYRLGPIGFLAPLADETPGNVGLLDQQLALKWVRDNIREFGGNPNNVTVMGESAGAASIGLHTIAPSSRGLFSRYFTNLCTIYVILLHYLYSTWVQHNYQQPNVFLYHLSYRVSTNPWPIWMGVMHGYEIELMFGTPWFGNSKFTRGYSDLDRSVSRRMVRYWTNFAKFGFVVLQIYSSVTEFVFWKRTY